MNVRYPRHFEIYRLQATGEQPYLDEDEAHITYLDGAALSVIPAEDSAAGKPAWYLQTSAGGTRFALTFYSGLGTPLREAKWEKVDDELVLRTTKDLFYPDGDPGRRVPYADIVSVTRELSTDGVASVELKAPGKKSSAGRRSIAPGGIRVPVPEFGDWEGVVASSSAPQLERFGSGAVAAARTFADTEVTAVVSEAAVAGADPGGWTPPLTGSQLADELETVLAGGQPGVLMLERGAARIIPIALQAPSTTTVDPSEEIRRMQTRAREVELALEPDNGLGILLDEGRAWTKAIDTYLTCLGEAGADQAKFWTLGRERAAVLVWSGDKDTGTRALALHVVPAHWVSDRYDGKPERVDLRWDAASVQATKEKDA